MTSDASDDYEVAMGARPEADVLLAEARQERDALRKALAMHVERLHVLSDGVERLAAQRDELLAALRAYFEACECPAEASGDCERCAAARSLIAKVGDGS